MVIMETGIPDRFAHQRERSTKWGATTSMRIKLLLAFIFLLASTHPAFAAGGACPTSASYLNTTNPPARSSR